MSIWNDADGNYGSFNSQGSSGTHGVTQFIAVGQGFMVKAKAPGKAPLKFGLVMDDGVRVHNTQAYLKSTDAIANVLRLKVAGNANTYSDEIVVEFGHPTADGGAGKMFSFYETAPSLYTVKTDGNYSIDFRGEPGAVTIPLSFMAGVDGIYTLTASQLESFTSSSNITLEDVKAAKTQNLMQNPSYTFSSAKTDDGARFLLHFGGAFSVNDKEKIPPVTVYTSGNTVYISSTSGVMLKGEVIVYNMIGQPVIKRSLSENPLTSFAISGATGYYLVKVIAGDQVCSEKLFIDRLSNH
ncbi:MAG: T9SS type A sorting domain-containing protein [Bacteroidetes bacterium]|nr:T9SS type A sorting domain-containing protein [Bacteroidota bacterium]